MSLVSTGTEQAVSTPFETEYIKSNPVENTSSSALTSTQIHQTIGVIPSPASLQKDDVASQVNELVQNSKFVSDDVEHTNESQESSVDIPEEEKDVKEITTQTSDHGEPGLPESLFKCALPPNGLPPFAIFCPPKEPTRVCYICKLPPKRPTDSYRISYPLEVQRCFVLPIVPPESGRICARHYHLLRLHGSDTTKLFPFEHCRSLNDRKRIVCSLAPPQLQPEDPDSNMVTFLMNPASVNVGPSCEFSIPCKAVGPSIDQVNEDSVEPSSINEDISRQSTTVPITTRSQKYRSSTDSSLDTEDEASYDESTNDNSDSEQYEDSKMSKSSGMYHPMNPMVSSLLLQAQLANPSVNYNENDLGRDAKRRKKNISSNDKHMSANLQQSSMNRKKKKLKSGEDDMMNEANMSHFSNANLPSSYPPGYHPMQNGMNLGHMNRLNLNQNPFPMGLTGPSADMYQQFAHALMTLNSNTTNSGNRVSGLNEGNPSDQVIANLLQILQNSNNLQLQKTNSQMEQQMPQQMPQQIPGNQSSYGFSAPPGQGTLMQNYNMPNFQNGMNSVASLGLKVDSFGTSSGMYSSQLPSMQTPTDKEHLLKGIAKSDSAIANPSIPHEAPITSNPGLGGMFTNGNFDWASNASRNVSMPYNELSSHEFSTQNESDSNLNDLHRSRSSSISSNLLPTLIHQNSYFSIAQNPSDQSSSQSHNDSMNKSHLSQNDSSSIELFSPVAQLSQMFSANAGNASKPADNSSGKKTGDQSISTMFSLQNDGTQSSSLNTGNGNQSFSFNPTTSSTSPVGNISTSNMNSGSKNTTTVNEAASLFANTEASSTSNPQNFLSSLSSLTTNTFNTSSTLNDASMTNFNSMMNISNLKSSKLLKENSELFPFLNSNSNSVPSTPTNLSVNGNLRDGNIANSPFGHGQQSLSTRFLSTPLSLSRTNSQPHFSETGLNLFLPNYMNGLSMSKIAGNANTALTDFQVSGSNTPMYPGSATPDMFRSRSNSLQPTLSNTPSSFLNLAGLGATSGLSSTTSASSSATLSSFMSTTNTNPRS